MKKTIAALMVTGLLMGTASAAYCAEAVEIGTKAFSGCKRLKEVIFYSSIKKIGKKAFYKCTALKLLDNEGGGAKEIGASAFEGCTSLTGAYFSDDLEVIGSKAFYGWPHARKWFMENVNYYQHV